ncbi:unnamed protein product [Linum tenue]|uniref:Reverse transcriptase zinc-binding domain-containing protein n=1 Tax=Linum tenue TaxID=586396 RepID=A0AAV0KGC2_9ROSI|nr:unnamed protein product [Linum tenue]CAI0420544.1 unnamed protein product [Linum tenue]
MKQQCPEASQFPLSFIWQQVVSLKNCIFMWTAYQKSILTHDASKRRGFSFPSRYALCTSSEEDANHILLTILCL